MDRTDLARRLFGLKPGDSETAIGMARAIGTAVLDDIVGQSKAIRRKRGPGFFVFTAFDQGAIWESAEGLKAQMDLAERNSDEDLRETFRRLLARLEALPKGKTLIAIADPAGLRAYELDNDSPGMQLDAVLRDAARA
jgi:hypothetical protein